MKDTVGIVGLGRMGMPAAKRLMTAGYNVMGLDCRPEAIEAFVTNGGIGVSDCKSMAERAKTVIVFVLDDLQVKEVITGEQGLLTGATEESTIICMATISKENLEGVSQQCLNKHVAFVDCPCTGGPGRADNGTLTLIAAAPNKILEDCRPILETLGTIVHVGDTPGMGQAVKHCNQLLVSTTHAAVMEVILMAKHAGLDAKQVCDVVGSGVGGSDYFRLLATSVLDGSPAPCGLGLMCKDSNIVVNSGRQMKLPLIVAMAANQYFLAAESLGLEKEEGSALMKVLERFSEPDK